MEFVELTLILGVRVERVEFRDKGKIPFMDAKRSICEGDFLFFTLNIMMCGRNE